MTKRDLLNTTSVPPGSVPFPHDFQRHDVYLRELYPGDELIPKQVPYAELYYCIFDRVGDLIMIGDDIDHARAFCDDSELCLQLRH